MRSCYTTQGTYLALCADLEGVGWRGGKEAQEEIWLIGDVVWQKPIQHCKASFLQLKIKNKQIHKKTHTHKEYIIEKKIFSSKRLSL